MAQAMARERKGQKMSDTKQPTWKQIGTVGDVNPFEYDGGFIYQDETGIYPPELEYIQTQSESETGPWTVYRWSLDRCETVTVDGKTLLVPFGFSTRTDLPHPIAEYDEWFNSELESAASSIGRNVDEFRADLCTENLNMRAVAYLDLAQYHGFENFDSYPLTFTDLTELKARYHA